MGKNAVSNKTNLLLLVFLFFCTFVLHKMPLDESILNKITMLDKENGEILAKAMTILQVGG
jgi:hypothetical protein